MIIANKRRSGSMLALATAATVLFCAMAAFVIVLGDPAVSGLPADISAVQLPN